MINLHAAITPGQGAAGIPLGTRFECLLEEAKPHQIRRLSEKLSLCDFGPVKVWTKDGLVDQIGVSNGYLGSLPNGVHVGSSIADVEKCCDSTIEEDHEDNLIVCGSPGWCFETEEWAKDSTLAQNRNARVVEIFVFAVD